MSDVYRNPQSIAVIGMVGRFPGAPDVDAFWKNLIEGVASISFFDEETLAREGVSESMRRRADYVPARGVLTDIDQFDPEFFNISRREAMIMDPQHRLFLMAAWQALEKAGYDATTFSGPIGVFAGAMANTYLRRYVLLNKQAQQYVVRRHMTMGNDREFLPTFVSYKLDLHGPSLNVQTACSTSLVAIHLACQSLNSGESDLALAGGVAVSVPHRAGYVYQPGMIKSPDGYCRTFDAQARGAVFGQGLGIVVLKRLEEALADGDHIHAVIAGSAVNNDGSRKLGYSAPSVEGQASAIGEALAMAEVEPSEISMIEAHGTATELGDPTEVASLTKAFGPDLPKQYCAIGSVKTNIGHLETAAGVAGLIKTILSLEHETIPPSLHFNNPNPLIDFENSPFFVNTQARPWLSAEPRFAGVNSFGVGGTNVHLILAEAPPLPERSQSRGPQLLLLSARDDDALSRMRIGLAQHLEKHPQTPLDWAAFTLALGRRAFDHRYALVAGNSDRAVLGLSDTIGEGNDTLHPDQLIFLFPGQGSPYPRMAADLYRLELVFRENLDRCADHLLAQHEFDLLAVLFSEKNDATECHLTATAHAQLALLAIGYALYQQWAAWGVKPRALVGHSVGELTAACVAGVFSLEDALDLAFERGRLMQAMPTGAMASVSAAAEWVHRHLPNDVFIAAENSPTDCVVSGPSAALETWLEELNQLGVTHQRLATKHAFHTAAMAPAARAFGDMVRGVPRRVPTLPYFSNVTGEWQSAEQATNPDYWARHILEPVLFSASIEMVTSQGPCSFLECGPGLGLGMAVKRHPAASSLAVRASLPGKRRRRNDGMVMYQTLGDLWCAGCAVDWRAFYRDKPKRRIPLPTYPFELASYWVEPSREKSSRSSRDTQKETQTPRTKTDIEQWFYEPVWDPIDRDGHAQVDGEMDEDTQREFTDQWVLIYGDDQGFGEVLGQRFRDQGNRVTLVRMGEVFLEIDPDHYQLNPTKASHHERIIEDLSDKNELPTLVIHAWALVRGFSGEDTIPSDDQLTANLERDFYSLFYLAAALARRLSHGQRQHRLIVVANHTQAVLDGEPQRPFAAVQHGMVRVLDQEHEPMQVMHLDVDKWDSEQPPAFWLDQILALAANPGCPDAYLAIRGESLYRLAYPATELPRPEQPEHYAGNYLITGGLGGLGLSLAQHLAEHGAERLLLTTRQPFPARKDWPAWSQLWADPRDLEVAPPTSFDRVGDEDGSEYVRLENHLRETIGFRGLFQFDGAERALAQASCCLVLDYFKECGLNLRPGTLWTRPQLVAQLSILPSFRKMLDAFLRLLVDEGLLVTSPEGWLVQSTVNGYGNGEESCLNYARTYPKLAGILRLMIHCAAHYREALSGVIPAISVLYPRGDGQFLSGFLGETHHFNNQRLYASLLRKILIQLASRDGKEPLRILEVGGGGGGLTWKLMPALVQYNVSYTFTDLGATFVRTAREKAQANDWTMMDFELLDISRDGREQGFEHGSYDVVLGLNVVHATPDVCQTLGHLHNLLRPNGMLMLVESCLAQPWMDMTWGLAEGWWYFEDEGLRSRSALMDLDVWEQALQDVGFSAVRTFPNDRPARTQTDRGLILAHRDSQLDQPSTRARVTSEHYRVQPILAAILKLESLGVQVDVARADVADEVAMARIVADSESDQQPIRGIIHAAGLPDGRLLANRDKGSIERIFRAKLRGSLVLERLFCDRDLDFLVYCSTLHTVVGGRGKLAHCASNAVMDALARARHKQGRIAINWDAWREVGQAAAAQTRQYQRRLLPLDHPLFVARIDSPKEQIFRAHLNPTRDWVLGEHLLDGTPTLPGTAYLALVYEAWRLNGGISACVFHKVDLRKTLSVVAGACALVEVRFHEKDAGLRDFSVWARVSDQPDWSHHATGQIAELSENPPDQPPSIGLDDGWPLEPLSDSKNRGPRWRCDREGEVKDNRGSQRLALNPAYLDDFRTFSLHPALLDLASGFLARARTKRSFIPMAYERVCVYRPFGANLAVEAHLREGRMTVDHSVLQDVFIADGDGRLCLVMEGFALTSRASNSKEITHKERNVGIRLDRTAVQQFRAIGLPRPKPKPGEIEIRVSHAGLNFKDILRSLGLVGNRGDSVWLGMECSGQVVRVGEGVSDFQLGDSVIAFAKPATQSYLLVAVEQVFPMPHGLSNEEATTLPVAFLTAEWALTELGRLQAGERVLIHCASGGVGLAAVQVVQAAGGVVMATAGSNEKRSFLKELGIDLVMDSRAFNYAERVLEVTEGRGVDLVLNALSGEHVRQGCSVLAPGGRFLDLARHVGDQAETANLAAITANRAYFAVTAGPSNPGFRALFSRVLDRIESRLYQPLPFKAFPASRISEGYQLLAKAGHIGKVLIALTGVTSLPQASENSTKHQESLSTGSGSTHFKGEGGMSPQEGVQVFARAIAAGKARVVVATGNHPMLGGTVKAESRAEALESRPAKMVREGKGKPPRGDVLRSALTNLWRDFLGLEEIQPEKSFLDLGGDSLLALQMVDRMDRRLGIKLSSYSLLHCSSFSELEKEVVSLSRGSSVKQSLVALAGTEFDLGPHLFLIHPVEGGITCYLPLARTLGDGCRVSAIQDPGLLGTANKAASLAERAAEYIRMIQCEQPKGPYDLGGFSFGGLVAFEMACQLTRAGEVVANLVMFDTFAPHMMTAGFEADETIMAFLLADKQPMAENEARLKVMTHEQRIAYFLSQWGLSDQAGIASAREWVASLLRVFRDNLGLAKNYQPSTYQGNVSYLYADTKLPGFPEGSLQYWQTQIGSTFEAQSVSAHHLNLMQAATVPQYAGTLSCLLSH